MISACKLRYKIYFTACLFTILCYIIKTIGLLKENPNNITRGTEVITLFIKFFEITSHFFELHGISI